MTIVQSYEATAKRLADDLRSSIGTAATIFVFFARRGELASNRTEDQELSMLALHRVIFPRSDHFPIIAIRFHPNSLVSILNGEPRNVIPSGNGGWKFCEDIKEAPQGPRLAEDRLHDNQKKPRAASMSQLHYLEKKYGIRINLLGWSGDNYETGTLNALIKISGTDVGRILLESIAYHVVHDPQNLLNGVVEIRPYGDGGCQGMASPEKTTKGGKRIQPVVFFWPKAYATGGACSNYVEDHREETGNILPDEALFHEGAGSMAGQFLATNVSITCRASAPSSDLEKAIAPNFKSFPSEVRLNWKTYSATSSMRP